MEKTQKPDGITAELIGLVGNLTSQINQLSEQIAAIPVVFNNGVNVAGNAAISSVNEGPRLIKGNKSNIIPFPVNNLPLYQGPRSSYSRTGSLGYLAPALLPVLAEPGRPLPPHIPDCRPILQRDGLVLLAWDRRDTEEGEKFTAYWVTSTGIARFYASKLLFFADLPSARPDHKSYAAEDGIEFYGQKAPAYIVHVAPELMKSNPKHGELRTDHINLLKNMGSKVNFNHKYLLKTEKMNKVLVKKTNDSAGDQAG